MTTFRLGMALSLPIALLFGFSSVASSQALETSPAAQFDTSPPLSTLIDLAAAEPAGGDADGLDDGEDEPFAPLPLAGSEPADTVLQAPGPSPSGDVRAPVGLNFPGLSIGAAGGGLVTPPDTNGAVGATQYVQWVNLAFAIYDKTTGAIQAGPFKGNTLWAGFGGDCETLNSGDPVIAYDRMANRWVFTQFAINTAAGRGAECVAISTTSDARGPYFRYQFNYGQFVDYPKIGTWNDAYYATYNTFSFATGNPFLGAKLCALQRSAMLNGLPAVQVCFQLPNAFFAVLPADVDGTIPPPAGTPELLMSQDATVSPASVLNLFKFHVDFATPANSTLTLQTLNVAPYADPCLNAARGACIPQPGTANMLESLTVHLMHRLVWRMAGGREELLANHTIVSGASTGIRWYEIRTPSTAPTVFQQGTFAPDASWRWMASIAMDKMGNIGLGYSVSDGTSTFPSVRFTGRLRSELRNVMETEATIQPGLGSQPTVHRWGDYSALTIDPVDDCTFYYTNEYLPATTNLWTTRIASFKFPNCH